MGGLSWWLDNLCAKEAILRRHYAPNGFMYLCHTTTRSLMEELRAALRPLASFSPGNAVPGSPTKKAEAAVKPVAPPSPARSNSSNSSATSKANIRSPPVRSKTQRPMSFVQNSPTKTNNGGPPHQYRRTQSQHSGLSPKKCQQQQQQQPQQVDKAELKVDELRQKWESLCRDKKGSEAVTNAGGSHTKADVITPNSQHSADTTVKSRIPRPVFRSNK